MNERIYLGIKSHVVCIKQETGREVWRIQLEKGQITNVAVCGDIVVAYSGGILFGLRAEDGEILWKNELNGLGYGYCIIAGDSSSVVSAAAQQAAQQAQLAATIAVTAAAAG